MLPNWQTLCSTVLSFRTATNKDKGQGCNVKAAQLPQDSHYKWVTSTQTILSLSTATGPSRWNGSSWSFGMKIRDRHDLRTAWKYFLKLSYSLVNNSLPTWTERQWVEDKSLWVIGREQGQLGRSAPLQEGRLKRVWPAWGERHLMLSGIALATLKSLVFNSVELQLKMVRKSLSKDNIVRPTIWCVIATNS